MVLHYDTEPNLFRVQVALEVTKFRERIAKYVAFFRRGAKLCIRMYEYVLAGTFVSTFALRFELRCTVLTHDFAGAFVRAKIITLSISGCARCPARVGEATHPGPRRGRIPRAGDLEARPVQSAATLSFEAKLWDEFQVWCAACLSDSLSVFFLCPVLAAMALRAYGNHCFAAGKTLSGFRHTIIAAQRRLLGCKPFLHLAWELVTRLGNLGASCASLSSAGADCESCGLFGTFLAVVSLGSCRLAGFLRPGAGGRSSALSSLRPPLPL